MSVQILSPFPRYCDWFRGDQQISKADLHGRSALPKMVGPFGPLPNEPRPEGPCGFFLLLVLLPGKCLFSTGFPRGERLFLGFVMEARLQVGARPAVGGQAQWLTLGRKWVSAAGMTITAGGEGVGGSGRADGAG